MKLLKTLPLLLLIAPLLGCNTSTQAAPPSEDRISPEFKKAGGVAFDLMRQALQGEQVRASDVSRAMAEAKTSASSLRENKVMTVLERLRWKIIEIHSAKDVKAVFPCKKAATDVFESYGDIENFDKDYELCVNPETKAGPNKQ